MNLSFQFGTYVSGVDPGVFDRGLNHNGGSLKKGVWGAQPPQKL